MFRLLEQLYAIPNQKAIVSKLNEFLSSKFLATAEAWTHPLLKAKLWSNVNLLQQPLEFPNTLVENWSLLKPWK